MEPARQLAQLFEPGVELLGGDTEQLARRLGIGAPSLLCGPHRDRGRHESLLRAVVEVALELPALLVAGSDDAGARGL